MTLDPELLHLRREVDQMRTDRDNLAKLLRRVLRKMRQYEMDVDADPPNHHRELMEAAAKLLLSLGYSTPIA